jgi:glycosyltransferase involved in cell wall biosynthesis
VLYVINDTEVSLSGKSAVSTSQGGTSAFVAGFINHLISSKVKFVLLGNFNCSGPDTFLHQIKARSNLAFLAGLLAFFIKKRLSANDLLYFQRPDHLAFSFFSPAVKVMHLHGPVRSTIISGKRFIPKNVFLFLEYLAIRKADLLIATDHRTASLYKANNPHITGKIHVIPAGFDFSYFHQKSELPSVADSKNEKRLLYAGRLAHPKRLKDMIEAFALASVLNDDLVFYIAGDGPLLKLSREWAEQKGVGGRVVFTGSLSKSKLRELMHSCHAGILLSHSEGSPISVKEMLSCGKPMIVNDVGDLSDYILNDKSGYIVRVANHHQVADAIVKAVENCEKMAFSCVEMSKKYNEKRVNKQILNSILQIYPEQLHRQIFE